MNRYIFRFAFFIFFLLLSRLLVAQHLPTLEGKWQIISLSDQEMTLNFKTGSITYSPDVKFGTDSAGITAVFSALGQMMRDYVYVFGTDGYFESLHNGISDGKGSYTVSNKDSVMTTVVNRNNLIVNEKMKFYIKDKQLYISPMTEDFPVKLVFEKVTGKEK
jgi:hypothetical protein